MSKPDFQVIFLKGMSGSGRKTLAQILHDNMPTPVVVDAFCFEFRERCHAAFKIVGQDRLPAPPMVFEGQLDEALDIFNGVTPRTAYTEFQSFINRTIGQEAMGQWVVDRIGFYRAMQLRKYADTPEKHANTAILVDDAPLSSYQTIVDTFGAENCTQILVSRDGSSAAPLNLFDAKSNHPVQTVRVNNRGKNVEDFAEAIKKAAPHLFESVAIPSEEESNG